jgi:hypothetical protein
VRPLVLLIGLIPFSFPAAAQVYSVSGVWAAIDPQFPADRDEICIAVKTFGVETKINSGDDYLYGRQRKMWAFTPTDLKTDQQRNDFGRRTMEHTFVSRLPSPAPSQVDWKS